jgi:hypothetical protein
MTTLYCRIELKKEKGITVKVEDAQGKLTQTIEMDGTLIKLTCRDQNSGDVSTITQKADSVEIKCKTFEVAAETVTVKSTKDTLHKSDQKMDIESTKEMTLKSEDKLTAKATSDFLASGSKLTASADGAAELKGASVDVKATQAANVSGLTAKVSGTQSVEVTGGVSAKVSSNATLNLEGQMTTLKGSITNVQGSLVKLG